MKLIHKVEECAVYESNKHSYASFSSSKENDPPPIKTYLLKIAPTITESTTAASSQLLNELMVKIKHVTAHTSTSIKFKAQQVVPLKTFIEELHASSSDGMAYTLTLKLLADIGTQLERIRAERDVIVPFLSLEDIVVIVTSEPSDDKQEQQQHDKQEQHNKQEQKVFDFVFINSEKLLQTNKKAPKELVVDVPLKVNKHTSFLPIELPESALKRLPMRLTATSWYYSLSALCIYALLQHKFKNGEDDIERIGRPFLHTSLYFCLKRCLKPDPEERVLLYV
jgi:hypothetical protein